MISEHFRSNVYVRVFLTHANADAFVEQYVKNFGARVAYEFDIERLGDIKVIGLETPSFGNVSAVVTDHFDALPDMLQRTRVLYEVESVAAALEAAAADGANVLHGETPVPTGFQGRFEVAGGYVVELAAWSEEGRRFSKD